MSRTVVSVVGPVTSLSHYWAAHQLTQCSDLLIEVMRVQGLVVASILLLSLASLIPSVGGCNEAVCASIVSKCMLLQSCKCELHPDCTCCKVNTYNTQNL